MNEDFRDFLAALIAEKVQFLVVGAHAMAVHGVPRATGDLDVWLALEPDNAERVWRALAAFGAPAPDLGVLQEDLLTPDMVIQIGLPPSRLDLLTGISGVEFADAWAERVLVTIEGLEVPFLGRRTLIKNKRATGRLKDRADLEALGEVE